MRISLPRCTARLLAPLVVLSAAACTADKSLSTAPNPAAVTAVADIVILSTTNTIETQIASEIGLTADVKTPAQWGAMTTADFQQYKAVVLADPTCSALPAVQPAIDNRAVWSAAINGNIIFIGTDENFHTFQGGRDFAKRALAFAANQAGKTGLYVSLSCYYHETAEHTPVPLLDRFGAFTVRGVGCFNDAHIVASHPALTGITDATLSNWSCSVHEAFDQWPASFEVLTIARNIGSSFTASDGTVGTPYILARGAGLVAISDITLTPASATNPVGTPHTLTATVKSGGTPLAGVTVTFTIESGPHAGQTADRTTNASGVATWTYTGTATGTDIIRARFTRNGVTQTSSAASKTWVPGTSRDVTNPSCTLTSKGTNGAGHTFIEVTAQDNGSGLQSIVVSKSTNADVLVPPFTVGTRNATIVTGTKIDQARSSQIELRVKDVEGNETVCDPVEADVGGGGRWGSLKILNGIPQAEGKISITNGAKGVTAFVAVVNGTRYDASNLVSNELRTLDVRASMKSGSANTIVLRAIGPKGSSVNVLIWDGQGDPLFASQNGRAGVISIP